METGNRLTDSCQGKGGGAEWWKEGGGTTQRTYVNDPWTMTMGWGWTVGVGVWVGRRRANGEKLGQL